MCDRSKDFSGGIMKIDAHMHVNNNHFSLRRLIRYLDANHFDCCWLLTWEEITPRGWPYSHFSIEETYEFYMRYPSRIVPMYAPDPAREDASERLVEWHKKGIRGCGELKATLRWDSIEVNRVLSTVEQLGMPLVFHMQENGYALASLGHHDQFVVRVLNTSRLHAVPKHVFSFLSRYLPPLQEWKQRRVYYFPGYMLDFASLEAALTSYPHTKFIAHGPLFWKHISSDAHNGGPVYPSGPVVGEGIACRLLAQYPNLYADISGGSGFFALQRDPKFAKKFLSDFSHKLLFGTDNWLLGQEDFLASLNLSKTTLTRVYGANAVDLLAEPSATGEMHVEGSSAVATELRVSNG
jgi:predicted TIM-barrel fold metal-dependent hydrolase